MNRAIKYRLYPTTAQTELFAKTFGCCRKVYNLMLADKIEHYHTTGKSLMTTPAQYKTDYPYLREVDSLALANEQLNLQRAYGNFFRDKSVGFPKFKSAKHSRKSYTTNNQKGSVAVTGNAVKLPKVGTVKAKIHRLPGKDWALKSATISRNADGKFYVSILYETGTAPVPPAEISDLSTVSAIGLDYKSDGLYMDSNGNIGSNHKYYRESHKKLAREQRKLSRKTIGSNNYRKQQLRVAKIHQKISNQRLDNLHKLSAEITNQHEIICAESLNMKSMANRGFGNGKATLDNGYGMFLTFVAYKQAARGHHFVQVDKFYPSSQLTHCHGIRISLMKDLRLRTITCPECGKTYDRDLNAAKNILAEGLRLLSA